MTKQEKVDLEEIRQSISHAANLMEELSQETLAKIDIIHNEGFSLAHCLRWGESAINDVFDEFDV